MRVSVLLFAAAKEAAQTEAISVELPESATAADVLHALAAQVPGLAPLVPSCRLAVDCCYVADDAAIESSSELALIPPVSGG